MSETTGSRARRKGKRGENEVAAKLSALLGDQSITRNLTQHQDAGEPDLTGESIDHLHIEIKRRATDSEMRYGVWFRVSEVATSDSGKIPIIIARTDRGDWRAYPVLTLDQLAFIIPPLKTTPS